MQPTPRARELSQPVHAALAQVRRAVAAPRFQPETCSLALRIATTDDLEVTLIPRLVEELRARAPGMSLVMRRLAGIFELPLEELRLGKLDFAIGRFAHQTSLATEIQSRPLYEDVLACIARAAHPGVTRRLTLKRFLQLEHAVVIYPEEGTGLIDRLLAQGVRRRVAVTVPHFTTAAFAVSGTDWVATVPQEFARAIAGRLRLQIAPLPLKVPSFEINLLWHGRNAEEPAHAWFRELIGATAERLYGRTRHARGLVRAVK
jgi:DNA-binding transcriptional LysR family regulator